MFQVSMISRIGIRKSVTIAGTIYPYRKCIPKELKEVKCREEKSFMQNEKNNIMLVSYI